MILMVLVSHIQLDQVYTQQSKLTTELTALQKDYEDLSSQYEQVFDMETIKTSLTQNGSMIQLTPEQQTYMDLSRPDSAEIIDEEPAEGAFSLANAFAQIVEYFR
jgi:FlaG/FlaF family flagellin (archaellin)